MPSVKDIRESFTKSKSLGALWHVHAFLDEDVFLITSGAVGIAWRLRARDYEGLDAREREAITHRFEQGLRLLPPQYRLYEYFIKTRADALAPPAVSNSNVAAALALRVDDLNSRASGRYTIDLYVVLVYEPTAHAGTRGRMLDILKHPAAALRARFDPRAIVTLREDDLRESHRRLLHTAQAFEVALGDDIPLTRAGKEETFRLFCRLVEYHAPHVRYRPDQPIAYQMARSEYRLYGTHLEAGPAYVKVLTMKTLPAKSFPLLTEDLYARVPGSFIACLEWSRIPNEQLLSTIDSARMHFNILKIPIFSFAFTGAHTTREDILKDPTAADIVKILGVMSKDVTIRGHFGGTCTLTIVVHDTTLDGVQHTVADLWSVLTKHNGAFLDEQSNRLRAWAAIVPGGTAWNVRADVKKPILETNLADMSFLMTLDQGDPENHVAVFETKAGTPYFFHLSDHGDDTRHMLILGSTGGGKSFLLNFLLMHLLRLNPYIAVFEVAKRSSYRNLTRYLGGSELALGLHPPVHINPFEVDGDPTPEHLHFLQAFIRVLLRGEDGFQPTPEQDEHLANAIGALYVLKPHLRTLGTLAKTVATLFPNRLAAWHGKGVYASVFDHEEDTLEMSDFQVFSFPDTKTYPAIIEPLQFYCLRRIEARMSPDRVTIGVHDELEQLMKMPTMLRHIQEAMPGWRKANGVLLLSTQHLEPLLHSDAATQIIESCPTVLFGYNDKRTRAVYGRSFRLNEQELDSLDILTPKREFLMKRGKFSKVLRLQVSEAEAKIYGNPVIQTVASQREVA